MAFPEIPRFLFEQVKKAEDRANKVYEAVIGIVVDNKDPDRLARIQVSFPTLPGSDKSWWAPTISLGAGKNRGWHFLPEPDDEVLVMFEHGDIRKPLIIGSLWNGKDLPPEKNDGANERKTFQSREGSRIEFDDAAGTITFEDGGGIAKITITTENKIIFEALKGDVCVQAPSKDLNVVAKDIEMVATENFNIQSGKALTYGCGGKAEYKSNSMLTVIGKRLDMNPGSAKTAKEAKAECEEVPDPIGP